MSYNFLFEPEIRWKCSFSVWFQSVKIKVNLLPSSAAHGFKTLDFSFDHPTWTTILDFRVKCEFVHSTRIKRSTVRRTHETVYNLFSSRQSCQCWTQFWPPRGPWSSSSFTYGPFQSLSSAWGPCPNLSRTYGPFTSSSSTWGICSNFSRSGPGINLRHHKVETPAWGQGLASSHSFKSGVSFWFNFLLLRSRWNHGNSPFSKVQPRVHLLRLSFSIALKSGLYTFFQIF